jgi:para-nitrobenzyl esterase
VTTFAPSAILTREGVRKYSAKFGEKAEDFVKFCDGLTDTDIAVAMTDSNVYRARMFAETQLHNHMRPAYLYCNIRRAPGDFEGAYHGFEHWYVFQTLDRDWRKYAGSDYEMSDMMAEYWANFVKNGDPNGPELPVWTPYTRNDKRTMMMDVSPWMGERKLPKIQQYKLDYFLDKYKDRFRD